MNNNIEKQLKKLQSLSLSTSEKQEIRRVLQSQMQEALEDTRTSIPSPFANHTRRFILRPLQIMTMATVIILGSGAGLTYAAQGALPGDALYNIKVNFNEEIRGWAYNNPQDKATYEISRAAKRLEETAQLAMTGKLTDEAVTDIQAQIEKHTTRTKREADKIKVESPEQERTITTKLATELEVHTKNLTDIKESQNLNGKMSAILATTKSELAEITERYFASLEERDIEITDEIRGEILAKYTEAETAIARINERLTRNADELRSNLDSLDAELAELDAEEITMTTDDEVSIATDIVASADNETVTSKNTADATISSENETIENNNENDTRITRNDIADEIDEETSIISVSASTETTEEDRAETIQATIRAKDYIEEMLVQARQLEEEGKYREALNILEQALAESRTIFTEAYLQDIKEYEQTLLGDTQPEKDAEVNVTPAVEGEIKEATTSSNLKTNTTLSTTNNTTAVKADTEVQSSINLR